MTGKDVLFNVFILLSLASVAHSESAEETRCVYTLYIRTGWYENAGTNAAIGLELWNERRERVIIEDIKRWGTLKDGRYSHFQRGSLDVFSGLGRCLSAAVCGMRLVSDGSGRNPDWYCQYIEVTTTGAGVHCAKQTFEVDQWLYGYRSIERNYCPYDRISQGQAQA